MLTNIYLIASARGNNMKKTNKQLKVGALALIAGLSSTAAVAETADGVAITTVITPLIINNLATMDFTTISSGTNGGVLTMDAAGAVTVLSGDADIIGAGTGAALAFDISGEASQAYTLTVGNGVLSDGLATPNTMAVTTDAVTAPTLTVAPQTVTVSGDLTVGGSQPAGSYSTANTGGTPIAITANYN